MPGTQNTDARLALIVNTWLDTEQTRSAHAWSGLGREQQRGSNLFTDDRSAMGQFTIADRRPRVATAGLSQQALQQSHDVSYRIRRAPGAHARAGRTRARARHG